MKDTDAQQLATAKQQYNQQNNITKKNKKRLWIIVRVYFARECETRNKSRKKRAHRVTKAKY